MAAISALGSTAGRQSRAELRVRSPCPSPPPPPAPEDCPHRRTWRSDEMPRPGSSDGHGGRTTRPDRTLALAHRTRPRRQVARPGEHPPSMERFASPADPAPTRWPPEMSPARRRSGIAEIGRGRSWSGSRWGLVCGVPGSQDQEVRGYPGVGHLRVGPGCGLVGVRLADRFECELRV
jgi:hypothetical protein